MQLALLALGGAVLLLVGFAWRHRTQPQAMERSLHLALCAVTAASELALAVRKTFVQGEEVIKADQSPVTIGDFAIQALVSLFLKETEPDGKLRLVAEEDTETLQSDEALLRIVTDLVNAHYPLPGREWTSAQVLAALGNGGDGGGEGTFWFLDPIDGTKGFVRGGQFAIGLGRVEDAKLCVAAIGCPSLPGLGGDPVNDVGGPGFLFGALLSEQDGWAGAATLAAAKSVRVDDPPTRWRESIMGQLQADGAASPGEQAGRGSRELVTTESYERPCCRDYACLAGARPCAIDSMAKYCLVARGDASVYVRKSAAGKENIWDHSAALVVLASGGRVTDFQGRALHFGRGRRLAGNHGVIATGVGWGALHETLLMEMRKEWYAKYGIQAHTEDAELSQLQGKPGP